MRVPVACPVRPSYVSTPPWVQRSGRSRHRQREAEMERKRQVREARQQEKETNRQIRQELKRRNLEMAHEMQHERRVASEGREKSPDVRDEIIVALPLIPEPAVASQALDIPKDNRKWKAATTPIRTARPKRPCLAVESDREMVVAFRGTGRPQRNSKRPRWLDDCEID
ncbi:hypothetical protein BKA56DRAFT_574669 [Ilyonectria sp. MPI-CAGE-AT-0026]|nr:hypothetical protein BKA56DRAFT_574669 [Ilyonectria sp. MPI-CAGE-AT-0026]